MFLNPCRKTFRARRHAFTFPDFLVILAVLALLLAIALPLWTKARSRSQLEVCRSRLAKIGQAILLYSEQNDSKLPDAEPDPRKPVWWFYKERVKSFVGLTVPSSAADKEFACPADRGYEDGKPFRLSAKFDYTSYTYNGVHLPGVPNVAGRSTSSIKEPPRTLLVMEWVAHGPLSWHRSRTGSRNEPFYNNAESVVAFVDGRVDFIPIYYDGMNAAYTRDPIPGYQYKYSGD